MDTFDNLADELRRRFAAGVDTGWTESDFTMLALAAFAIQFESIEPYRRFCQGRASTPATVRRWQDVPSVPATAFKHFDFVVDAAGSPEATFRTSGTTRGGEPRGRHLVPRTSLYRSSLLPPIAVHVLGGRPCMRFLSLVPSPRERPDSSLSFMVGAAADELASETHWLVDGSGALDAAAWRREADRATGAGEPVAVFATSLALLHLVEGLETRPSSPLPTGSRIMETGGFKGSGREVARGDLHRRVYAATSVPSHHVIGEYGMTELLSQLYEPVLRDGAEAAGRYVAPPWVRVRALDPMSLEEMPQGQEGLLAFFDLANAGSVCHVLTEDVGAVVAGSVRLSGRARGAEPRGCSRAMDELLLTARAADAHPRTEMPTS